MADTTKRLFSTAVKRLAWQRANHQCQECTAPVTGAGDMTFDHVVPWELSRDSSLGNAQVLCLTCNSSKTYQIDIPAIAEAQRKQDFHIGITGPGKGRHPLPCGRASRWSKPIAAFRPIGRTNLVEKLARMRANRRVSP